MALLAPQRRFRAGPARSALGLLAAAAGLLLLAAAPFAAPDLVRADPGDLETAVKANYLFKVAPFVTWPARAFADPHAPFAICILGEDPFGSALDQATRGQTVAGRAVAVRRVRTLSDADQCQVVYLGRLKDEAAKDALKDLGGRPILTVTDDAGGVPGGVFRFVVRDGRVRFTVDLAAAQAAGLTLSSKLLALALTVQRGAE